MTVFTIAERRGRESGGGEELRVGWKDILSEGRVGRRLFCMRGGKEVGLVLRKKGRRKGYSIDRCW